MSISIFEDKLARNFRDFQSSFNLRIMNRLKIFVLSTKGRLQISPGISYGETGVRETWDTLSMPHSSRLQPQRVSRAFACIYLKLAKLTRLALGGSVNIMHIAVRGREGPSVRARGMRTGWISTTHPRFDDTRDRSSLLALKCANNRSARIPFGNAAIPLDK